MSADRFFDTNVFIYHLDSSDAAKHQIAEELVRGALEARDACISYQVVQECLNIVTRKAKLALSVEAARTYLDVVLMPLLRVSASEAL
ncbi:MAG: PIN domain-containing protein [Burkholderiaceae bacterium]